MSTPAILPAATRRIGLEANGIITLEDRLFQAVDGSFYKLQFSPTLNPEERLEHSEAVALAQQCSLDPDGGAWDAPEIHELAALVDYTQLDPAVAHELKGSTKPSWHWSKTGYASVSSYAWGVYFGGGGVGIYLRNDGDGFVRAVRRVPASQS